MTASFYVLSLLYIVTLGLIVAVELRRCGKLTADPVGVFVLLTTLQCILPAAAICALLPFSKRGFATGVEIFDRIYSATDATTAFVVFGLTFWFLVFVYVGAISCESALAARFDTSASPVRYEIRVSIGRLITLLAVGLAVSILAFQTMGDSFLDRYTNMILLRSDDAGVERTMLNSNALSLLQTWSWLTVVALFAVGERKGRSALWYLCFGMLVVFSVLAVSRRALFLPVLFSYLIFAMNDGRWRLGTLALIGAAVLPFIAFGEELFGALSYGGSLESVEHTYGSVTTGALRTSSEIGISVTESLGTVSMMDLPPRYGIDHLLSAARRVPEGILGIDIEFPERVVRISTETFANSWDVDVPPGLMGQMWLDFRVLGPVLWGLAFGVQVGVLQFAYKRTAKSLQAAATYFVLVFVVALPINTGSFDFTFSIDVIILLMVLFICVNVARTNDSRAPIAATLRRVQPH